MNMLPWFVMIHLHNDAFDAERDVGPLCETLRLNRIPNGLYRAMSVANHSYIGTYGEAMGIIGPIGEMMLQSWDGIVRVFPDWPPSTNCSFRTLRAEGAFLVSATLKDGRVSDVVLHSERGAACRFESPWPAGVKVVDKDGAEVTTSVDGNVVCFDTAAGGTYELVSL